MVTGVVEADANVDNVEARGRDCRRLVSQPVEEFEECDDDGDSGDVLVVVVAVTCFSSWSWKEEKGLVIGSKVPSLSRVSSTLTMPAATSAARTASSMTVTANNMA